MAPGTRPHLVDIHGIHDDHPDIRTTSSAFNKQQVDPSPFILGELPLGNIQNIVAKPTVDSLAVDLSNFHIEGFTKEKLQDHPLPELPTKTRGRKARPRFEFSTFQAPLSTQYEEQDEGVCCKAAWNVSKAGATIASVDAEGLRETHILATAIQEVHSNAEQVKKHHAGQFEWLLALPAAGHGSDSARDDRPLDLFSREHNHGSPREREKRLLFGCNLVRRKASAGEGFDNKTHDHPADIYTILATRVEADEETDNTDAAAVEDMSIVTTHADTTIIRMASPLPEEPGERRTSEVALSVKNDDIVEQLIALPPANPASRIEDSVEALDKLEEELEALNEVAHLDRVLSPETSKGGAVAVTQTIDSSLKRTGSTARKSGAGTVRVRSTVDRSSSVRKSASMSFSQDDGAKSATSANSKAPRKSLVTRPASLLPPKPPARSSKPPTVPTFELPGEAVARRLKEQREARRSQQISSEQAAAVKEAFSPSKPHVRSTKPPTRPTFELPGEAISRRKREQREAQLRAQEEEERRRREFKARPIRASIVPSSYPRETIASRARQSKLAAEAEAATATTPATVRKRHSLAVPPSATPRASLSVSRGRTELAAPSATSRATSTSTGSIHGGGGAGSSAVSVGKRSSVSAEEQERQRARGKEVFKRDNSGHAERERERREREAATRAARQEAAERSRQLSREWAEKQQQQGRGSSAKRMSMAV